MKLLIITTDEKVLKWKTLSEKKKAIESALNKTPNAIWEVEIVYRDLVPELNSRGRITQRWFNDLAYPLFNKGYYFIHLHFKQEHWRNLGLDKSIRGANQIDDDFVGQSYSWASQYSLRNGLNQFVQTILHETSHELARGIGVKDQTHYWHDNNPDISGIFAHYDMKLWHPNYQTVKQLKFDVSNLVALFNRFFSKTQYRKPLREHWDRPSQAYGVPNSAWYPITGHHIGVDFPTPVGTPIFAPKECKVTRTGYMGGSLGNWCEVKIDNWYAVFAHLEFRPNVGYRDVGWVIGFSGNTGMSFSPHTHVEGWHEPMDTNKLSPSTWRELTFDITTKIK